jgi:hypothetical protein
MVDPRFVRPLAVALSAGPVSELELRALFLRDVPNRSVSKRLLTMLLVHSQEAGLIQFDQGVWRGAFCGDIDQAVARCLECWTRPGFSRDKLFQSRSAVCLGRGIISASGDFCSIEDLASRHSLSPVEWAKLISGPSDIRQLCGFNSKHVEADFLMLYRNLEAAPIGDDSDVLPRVPLSLLPPLPCSPDVLRAGVRRARASWNEQLKEYLEGISLQDFAEFIIYAKDFLDQLFFGASAPLQSVVSHDHLVKVSGDLQRFGVRAEDLATVWRGLLSVYRLISRLSWGLRYLSNNLSCPNPPGPDVEAFVKICSLPAEKQLAISAGRSGCSLMALVRPLRLLHRALGAWPGRSALVASARDCATAISSDGISDKLLRREFSARIRSLNVIGPVEILDALAGELVAPKFPDEKDAALCSAGLIAAFSQFIASPQGRAYAEVRLALHAELDFQRRFNLHNLSPPQRYEGVWRGTLQQLVGRLEDTRKAFIPT